MIRVDAVNRMDVDDDEISEALGEDPARFDVLSSRYASPPATSVSAGSR